MRDFFADAAGRIGLSVAVSVIVLVIGLAVALWARRHPHRSSVHPGRVRMPRFVLVAGLLALGVAVLFALTAHLARFPLGMEIAAIVLLVVGSLVLLAYINWFIEPGPDAVHARTFFGRRKVIVYGEIVRYQFSTMNGQQYVSVVSSNGDSLTLSITKYDVTPLLAAIEFRRDRGRWPLVGERAALPPG
ncbi:hypothetical protein [Microbacterium sp. W4I20]|uniref:hypothetical protein n=1 Tax=Microbacterium sp. W4I20 TaxID=3042262 RepID=UPI0027800805|nr:hypothetical protein [Microbacterium sp. W4I20]MDQ0727172.1 hypothetical protein [Microbacterium sp. W4I20]